MYQSRKRLPPSMSNCLTCVMRPECIRCSALAQNDRRHPEKLRDLVVREIYRNTEPTEAMLRGTEDHKTLERMRSVDTDPDSIIKRIRNKDTFYWSMTMCSVRYGLRGTPDAVLTDWQGDTVRFLIIDDKVFLKGSYFVQLWAYGMVLSDPFCLYTRSRDGEGEEVDRRPFYPALGENLDTIEIWTTLNPYKQGDGVVDRPIPAKPFSRGRVFVDKGLVFAVLRSKRKILNAFSEPALLAATKQMKFKRSGNELVVYEPKRKL